MGATFYERLLIYYLKVGAVLRGEAEAASIFPNGSDKGTNREVIYAEFLRQHAPAKCSIQFGGYLFHDDGRESGQLDVLVTTDTASRFDLFARAGGKSFSNVEGTLGVFAIKSTLDQKELYDVLRNFASIPPTGSLEGRTPPKFVISDYDDWPYKFLYASNGISSDSLNQHLTEFYREHPHIPLARRPNMIHVAGKHFTIRGKERGWNVSVDVEGNRVETGQFATFKFEPDVQAIVWTMHFLQIAAEASTQILFSNGNVLMKVSQELLKRQAAQKRDER